MFKKLLILTLCCIGQVYAQKIQIITSISPIYAITSMITKDRAQISSITSQNQCPHHYFLKPDQFLQLKKADLIIYLDNDFEVFINNPIKISTADTLKLSENKNLISHVNNKKNWHLWLDLENVKTMMNSILIKLCQIDAKNKTFYTDNYHQSIAQLEQIKAQMQNKFSQPFDCILLDSSLYYLFHNFKQDEQIQIIEMTNGPINSQIFTQIQNYTKQAKNKCVFISSHQNRAKLQSIFGNKVNIVSFEIESWGTEEQGEQILPKVMQEYINLIEKCV